MRFGFCCLLLLASVAHAAAPPLAPNEEIVKTKDGCGIVIQKDKKYADAHRKNYSELAWGGACIEGLAMGEGVVGPRRALPDDIYLEEIRGWAWYGRFFGRVEIRYSNGALSHVFMWENKGVHYDTLDPTQINWGNVRYAASSVSDGTTSVLAGTYIFVMQGEQHERFDCPKPNSTEGCESLWMHHAGPVMERIKAFLAQNEPKAEARRKEAELLVAKWKEQVGPELVAKGAAIAEALNEQGTQATEQHMQCYARELAARTSGLDHARLGKALKELYSGDCASDENAAAGLKAAEEEFASARKDQAFEQEQAERSAQRRRERFGQILGGVAEGLTTFQTTKNALEQQQAVHAQAQAQADAQARAQAQAQQAAMRSQQAQPQASTSQQLPQNNSYQVQPVQQASNESAYSAEANATSCLQLVPDKETNTGGFINKCGYGVNYVYCTMGSTDAGLGEVSSAFACSQSGFGSSGVSANARQTAGTKGARNVYVAACRDPYEPYNSQFTGNGISFTCKK